MASSTLYPPIVMDLQPAFVTGGEDPMNIYFSLPPFNSLKKDGGDIAHAQVVLIDQETNQNVFTFNFIKNKNVFNHMNFIQRYI